MNNNFNNFLNYFLYKKFNFIESIDLNITFNNKKKKYFSFFLDLFYSINEKKNFLFLSNNNNIENNIYFGNFYLNKFLKNEIFFQKIYSNKENFFLLEKNNLNKKFSKKKFLINNYIEKINELKEKKTKIIINKNNFINLTIGNVNFDKNMIEKNFFFIVNNLKKIFFQNNINIEKIYINTTMSKSFLIK